MQLLRRLAFVSLGIMLVLIVGGCLGMQLVTSPPIAPVDHIRTIELLASDEEPFTQGVITSLATTLGHEGYEVGDPEVARNALEASSLEFSNLTQTDRKQLTEYFPADGILILHIKVNEIGVTMHSGYPYPYLSRTHMVTLEASILDMDSGEVIWANTIEESHTADSLSDDDPVLRDLVVEKIAEELIPRRAYVRK